MLPHIIRNKLEDTERKNITDYVLQLQEAVENAAAALYFINNFADMENPKFRQWCSDAKAYLRGSHEVNFIAARYGYAVEEYVNLGILGGFPAVPSGYTVALQVTHMYTRPDIVILRSGANRANAEIAWLDITNQKSEWHVSHKTGNWENGKPFIAELLYPDFDPLRINLGIGGIASRAAANSIARREKVKNNERNLHLVGKMNAVFRELEIRTRKGERISKADVAKCVERHFRVRFNVSYKHPIIKSMLKMYVCLYNRGCDVYYAEDAQNCLNALYAKTGQSVADARAYIDESINAFNEFVYF